MAKQWRKQLHVTRIDPLTVDCPNKIKQINLFPLYVVTIFCILKMYSTLDSWLAKESYALIVSD